MQADPAKTRPASSERVTMIGDAAIEVLATKGSRGLTHRAVDLHLSWPEGTTSRYYRTRDALLTAVVQRLIEVEVSDIDAWRGATETDGPITRRRIARVLANALRHWVRGRTRQLARYELSLEGLRRPAVHDALIAGRKQLNGIVARALEADGFPAPEAQATLLVSAIDGLCHDYLLHPEIAVDARDVEDMLMRWLDAEHGAPGQGAVPSPGAK
ncbi:TetR/AcrR family transcriptional regulator [Salipiger abyssi]|uniref:Tetracyclin repressor-like C-terminal group 31 domain-containing protein n=1 Tax=Salipiger abyssi TaxID=1250539 RepID=A0A1P8UMD0_9RHOB|nr:TetR/AcrR family transcriptional regulator [Salipiger abyssi]APZ50559.1 hypothetical protein Ga0080574_TMP225 [Salipiger abyssi]